MVHRLFQWCIKKNPSAQETTWEEPFPGGTLRVTRQSLLTIADQVHGRIITSPDGRHVAYWMGGNRDYIPVIDGTPRPASYTGITPSYITFSADSRQAIYPAQRADYKWYVVTDDGEQGPYDRVASFPLGTLAAHSALLATRGKEEILLVDGVPGQPYEKIMPGFSCQTGTQVVYLGRRKRKWYAVVDGDEVATFAHTWPIFPSPDLQHVAWPVKQDDGSCVLMLDGVAHGPYTRHGAVTYSPDSTRRGYAFTRDGQQFVALDGDEYGPYDDVSSPYFSPDSRHSAYIVTRHTAEGIAQHLVVDGQPGPAFDGLHAITFSPDSARLAYIASRRDTKQHCLVLDHQPVGTWHDLLGGWGSEVLFTADSRHLASIARDGQRWQFLVDGAAVGPSYDQYVNAFRLDGPASFSFTMYNTTPAGHIEVLRLAVALPMIG